MHKYKLKVFPNGEYNLLKKYPFGYGNEYKETTSYTIEETVILLNLIEERIIDKKNNERKKTFEQLKRLKGEHEEVTASYENAIDTTDRYYKNLIFIEKEISKLEKVIDNG